MTARTIVYTPEFKTRYYEERQKGRTPEEILPDFNLDPKLLGRDKIHSLNMNSEKFVLHREKPEAEALPSKKEQSDSARITELENELAYTRRMLSF